MAAFTVRRSLRAKVTLAIVIPLTLILGVITKIQQVRHKEAVLDNLASLAAYSGQMIESSLRHAMLVSDFGEVQGILDTVGNSEEIQSVYLLDTDGRVIFAPFEKDVGQRLNNRDPKCMPCHGKPVDQRPGSIVVTDSQGQRVFRSMHPIENAPECKQCHDPDRRVLGLLLTDLSMAPVEEPLAADLRENVAWGAAAVLVTILMTYSVVSRLVLRRLDRFTPAIAGLRHSWTSLPVVEDAPDEIGRLAHAFNTMVGEVERRSTENAALAEGLRRESLERSQLLKRLITSQEDERQRVARELHDELGQYLSALALRAEAAEKFIPLDAERALEQTRVIQTLTREATERMYHLILDLRPSALDDLGLTAALRSLASRLFAETGIEWKVDAQALPDRLPPEIETVLYRICQEALCNVLRHAGATEVCLTLTQYPDHLEGVIVDNGQGFDPGLVSLDGNNPQGLGLIGMRERAAQCGGQLRIESAPGTGTQIRISIPHRKDVP